MTPQNPMLQFQDNEVQSAVTLVDFFRVWFRFRRWFFLGFFIALLGTYLWSKFGMVKYYRSDSVISVGRYIPPEQRVGFVDVAPSSASRNDQYLNVVQGVVTEQLLGSQDFLLEVARKMKSPQYQQELAKRTDLPEWARNLKPVDVHAILNIHEANQERADLVLIKTLRTDLIKVKSMQNTGVIQLSIDLPGPDGRNARQFANLCILSLQERFTRRDFGYYDEALNLYTEQVGKARQEIEKASAKYAQWYAKHGYDLDERVRKEKDLRKAELDSQARTLATYEDKLGKLRLATDARAKQAAQPVEVIDWGSLPLKVDRPKASLNAAIAASLYTFFFMVALVAVSYLNWNRRGRITNPDA